MKRRTHIVGLLVLLSLSTVATGRNVLPDSEIQSSRTVDPIVTTQWLEDHMDDANLVILDLRNPATYANGHIKGSVNITAPGNFFECFMNPNCGLWMELPPDDALFMTIGNAGITEESTVVIFGDTDVSQSLEAGYFGLTIAARVAVTLLYAGIENVAILDGGYTKWLAEDRSVSTETVTPASSAYRGGTNENIFVLKEYVESKVGKSILLDSRDADSYFGITQDMLSMGGGHIPTSKLLAAPWIWKSPEERSEATWLSWKDATETGEMASTILGDDKEEEIIVYCGAGGYASPVFYILAEQLGYKNVKFYDGSMQEWTADPEAPVVKYKYE